MNQKQEILSLRRQITEAKLSGENTKHIIQRLDELQKQPQVIKRVKLGLC
jgi:hypothetical protein